MSTHTIKSIMPTGKSNDQFGREYYVQFDGIDDVPAFWFKKEPAVGDELDIERNEKGQWKKVKKPWNPNGQTAAAKTATPAAASKPAWKDNSDGMRQGMWINNAASYVNTLEFPKALTDAEWAQTVFSYASAGYRLGDLNVAPEASQDVTEQSAAEVFGHGQ